MGYNKKGALACISLRMRWSGENTRIGKGKPFSISISYSLRLLSCDEYSKSLRPFPGPPSPDITDLRALFAGVSGKCLSTIKEEDQFYGLDYRKDGSVFAATGKNHTVRASTEIVGASKGFRGRRVVLRAFCCTCMGCSCGRSICVGEPKCGSPFSDGPD